MRRFQIRALKHLPYQMASLYFILFIISITASVITVNCGDEVFKKYTSCNGSKVHNINWIGALIVLQMALLFVSIEPEESQGSKTLGGIIEKEDKEEEGDVSGDENYNRRDNSGIYTRVLPGSDYKVKIEDTEEKKRKLSRKSKSKEIMIGLEEKNRIDEHEFGGEEKGRYGGRKGKTVDQSLRLDLSDSIITTKIIKAKEVLRGRVKICWSSIWMISYHFVIFMGVHGSLLASRIHAQISLNKYGIETCPHLSYFPLSLTSPKLKDPILSETVFLVTYLSFTIHEIVIRKTENCFLIKNFFGKHYFKESKMLGAVRLIIQIALFSANIGLIIVCITNGFGSPMHVLVGFSISMLALWINSLLSQLLELTHYGEMKAPTLDYSYIWSILSAFLLWFCGFFYYVSVYGVPYKRVYFYLHPLAWAILISLTYYKRKEIFSSSEYLQGFVPTFT
ncbi:conserved hypothetical protein [Theileria orientalis strain Shintoku]|uniref:Uncharacterized protein n=1 Tax=Theileria orientalis strain Shintoku TaxID=869250 RepID=J7MCF1_THEOR|nr:conserved hypothetical protein [Theileria orientalis strain Shintoku]PVC52715.1 hypothetical protein MACL_00000563 [Theileria orientalis]BAM42472.1 conserved hypothetical protein [Theileria orientalis strain Shintoku]|eukprot:XP_009692773.1 conserved hypothetical protein [Theileria orientalis strain Shintoku]